MSEVEQEALPPKKVYTHTIIKNGKEYKGRKVYQPKPGGKKNSGRKPDTPEDKIAKLNARIAALRNQ